MRCTGHRYYASTSGRFLTPDPYRASGGAADPQSWNRYAYTRGDLVNRNDPSGLQDVAAGEGGDQLVYCGTFGWIPEQVCRSWSTAPGGEGGNEDMPRVARGPKIKLKNVSKAGPNEDAILNTLSDIAAYLDDKCAKFLGGREAAVSRINSLIDTGGSPLIAHGSMQSDINAITGGRAEQFEGNSLAEAEGAVGYFAMLVNDSGAFFNSAGLTNNGRLQGNTAAVRRFILLHELAHSLEVGGFQADYGNPRAGRENNDLINSNCDQTFNH